MKETINSYFDLIFKIGLGVTILTTLFLFSNLTTEFYELPKLLVILLFVATLFILTGLRMAAEGKVSLIRTPLDLPFLILLVIAAASTVLSASPYVSLLGNAPQITGSLIMLVTVVLFYFLLVASLNGPKDAKIVLLLLLAAGVVLSAIGLLAYGGIKLLPDPWSHGVNFTTTGSNFSTNAFLILLLPFLVLEALESRLYSAKTLYAILLTLFGLNVLLTGDLPTYAAALIASALPLVILKDRISYRNAPFVVVPAVLITFVALLSFVPLLATPTNPFYPKAKDFPRQLQLSFPISWKISVSSFRDSPFWGTGPATYLFNFTTYKPIEFNNTKEWNLRFGEPFNEYLKVLAELGGIGFLALALAAAFFISSAYHIIRQKLIHSEGQNLNSPTRLTIALGLCGITFFILLLLHSSTLVVWVMGILILALFMAGTVKGRGESYPGSSRDNFQGLISRFANQVSPITASSSTISNPELPSIILVAAVIFALVITFFGGKFALADYYHRLALNAVSKNDGLTAYNNLVNAERLNPYNDLYHTDLSQTNFALANAIASAKGPTQSSPSGSLTDTDRQNIQALLQQAVEEGRTATNLSPRSAINWEILGNLYRQISGVAQNALLFSMDSYGRAIQNDPLNPLLRLNVGGIYYATQNYDLAIRFFTDAVNLKSDYPNGFYNLAVALRDRGDNQSALQAAQKAAELITDKESSDYKTVEQLIKELESKTQATDTTPPAAETDSALNEEKLPKVLDLPKPEKITTPSAVKKQEESKPTPSPNP